MTVLKTCSTFNGNCHPIPTFMIFDTFRHMWTAGRSVTLFTNSSKIFCPLPIKFLTAKSLMDLFFYIPSNVVYWWPDSPAVLLHSLLVVDCSSLPSGNLIIWEGWQEIMNISFFPTEWKFHWTHRSRSFSLIHF